MSISIIKAGILDTIQDKGRYGHQHLGINPSGAMDKYAMQVANILVGNQRGEAVIEMHYPAPVILFKQPALIAFSGADFSASINAEPVPSLHPVMVVKNDVLQFHKPVDGARAYLAVAGGIKSDAWLNSSSTHLKLKAGGHRGRSLQKGDVIFFKNPFPYPIRQEGFDVLPWMATTNWGDSSSEVLVLPGNEWDRLTAGSKENFTTTSFLITQQSDRMGYRLNNIPLQVNTHDEVVSSAVSFGTIQLLPEGKLIILMADHQTTGGYPRLAHVIVAHHSRLAQLKPGDSLQFRLTAQRTAENLYMKQQQHLMQLQNACTFRLENYFNESYN